MRSACATAPVHSLAKARSLRGLLPPYPRSIAAEVAALGRLDVLGLRGCSIRSRAHCGGYCPRTPALSPPRSQREADFLFSACATAPVHSLAKARSLRGLPPPRPHSIATSTSIPAAREGRAVSLSRDRSRGSLARPPQGHAGGRSTRPRRGAIAPSRVHSTAPPCSRKARPQRSRHRLRRSLGVFVG